MRFCPPGEVPRGLRAADRRGAGAQAALLGDLVQQRHAQIGRRRPAARLATSPNQNTQRRSCVWGAASTKMCVMSCVFYARFVADVLNSCHGQDGARLYSARTWSISTYQGKGEYDKARVMLCNCTYHLQRGRGKNMLCNCTCICPSTSALQAMHSIQKWLTDPWTVIEMPTTKAMRCPLSGILTS